MMSWSSSAAGLRAAVRLLLLGLFLSTEPASSVGDSERVSVFSGETATLPCSAPYSINDITAIAVEWSKRGLKDSYVLMFRDGRLDPDEQNPSYKSRVDLAEPELKNGNLSMILKNVTKKDEGLYECHFIDAAARQKRSISDTKPIKTIDLEVKEKPGDEKKEGGSNEGGSNEGGSNEGGSNEGGSNEGGSNEGGSNEGGSNEGGRAGIITGIIFGVVLVVGFFVLCKIMKKEQARSPDPAYASLEVSGSKKKKV